MNQRKYKESDKNEILITDIDGLCEMLSMGKQTALIIAQRAEARVELPFTKLKRYNIEKIKLYISENSY